MLISNGLTRSTIGGMLGCLVMLAGCADEGGTHDRIADASGSLGNRGGIDGHAYVRPNGWARVGCEGRKVRLIAATDRVRAFVLEEYGNDSQGFRPNSGLFPVIFDNEAASWKAIKSESGVYTRCDDGNAFHFSGVGRGTYYIFVNLTWRQGRGFAGGSLVRRIRVEDKRETIDINQTIPF